MGIGGDQDDDPVTSRNPVEQKLGDLFVTQEGTRRANYSDKEIQQVSDLLRILGRQSWSTVPRVYIVLRLTNQLQLLDMFIDQGITDIWFPFTERSLPDTLSPSRRAQFLECQSAVLTKALDLENGDHGKHAHFGRGEPLPFEFKATLGSGGYGTVDKVISLLSHREYARKAFKRGRNFSKAKEDIRSFLTEIQVLRRVQHIHCIELIGSYTDPKHFAFIMSPVADWNMTTYMSLAADSADKRSLLRTFFGCLANGLQYIHGSKIRHRDIKPENVLIQGDRVLLSDFGIALDWEHLSRSTTTADSAKSPIYCAPEVAQYQKRNSSSDIWSLGCVFLEMITVLKGEKIAVMRTFFKDRNDHYRFHGNIEATKEWIEKLWCLGSDEDNEPLNWITRMLNQNPELRPAALALLADINHSSTDVSVLFCGPCCRQDEDSSEGLDSDGELWDGHEHQSAKTKYNPSESGHIPIRQTNPTNRRNHSRSPVTLLIEAAGVGGSTSDAIEDPEDIHNLGVVYDKQGKLTEAEAMYKRALTGKEKVLGPDHTSTLDTVHGLGVVYARQERLGEAEAMYERALAGREKALGPDHTSTLSTVHGLGIVYDKQERLGEAEAMYKRALTGREKALGLDHASTLDTVYNLGTVYCKQGRLWEAKAMYERALTRWEKVLGPDHTSTLDTVHGLGVVYNKQEGLGEAEAMYKRALTGREKVFGPDNRSTLSIVHNLSVVYDKQKRLREAEAMYKPALTGREKALGLDHALTLDTAKGLRLAQKKNGKYWPWAKRRR
ncbi:MAG: hypothetical protein M1839_005420 [Geoglossum umbratile]|nr:MAG: hypothetical protein M1839_005420 [Geoglossum umbratile]